MSECRCLQKPKWGWIPDALGLELGARPHPDDWELEFQPMVSHLTRVLDAELRSSARVVYDLHR